MNDEDKRLICKVCIRQYARYTCPRCNVASCSLACYKRHSETCTETFYKEQTISELRGRKTDAADRRKMLEMLERVYQSQIHEDEQRMKHLSLEDPEFKSRKWLGTGSSRGGVGETDEDEDEEDGDDYYSHIDGSEEEEDESGGEEEDVDGLSKDQTYLFLRQTLSEETIARLLEKAAKLGAAMEIEESDLRPAEWKAFQTAVSKGQPAATRSLPQPREMWWEGFEARDVCLSARGLPLVAPTTPSPTVSSNHHAIGSTPPTTTHDTPEPHSGTSGMVKTATGTTKDATLTLPLPRPPSEPLPALSSLTKVSPSPQLAYHLVELLYGYCYVVRLFNGEIYPESEDSVDTEGGDESKVSAGKVLVEALETANNQPDDSSSVSKKNDIEAKAAAGITAPERSLAKCDTPSSLAEGRSNGTHETAISSSAAEHSDPQGLSADADASEASPHDSSLEALEILFALTSVIETPRAPASNPKSKSGSKSGSGRRLAKDEVSGPRRSSSAVGSDHSARQLSSRSTEEKEAPPTSVPATATVTSVSVAPSTVFSKEEEVPGSHVGSQRMSKGSEALAQNIDQPPQAPASPSNRASEQSSEHETTPVDVLSTKESVSSRPPTRAPPAVPKARGSTPLTSKRMASMTVPSPPSPTLPLPCSVREACFNAVSRACVPPVGDTTGRTRAVANLADVARLLGANRSCAILALNDLQRLAKHGSRRLKQEVKRAAAAAATAAAQAARGADEGEGGVGQRLLKTSEDDNKRKGSDHSAFKKDERIEPTSASAPVVAQRSRGGEACEDDDHEGDHGKGKRSAKAEDDKDECVGAIERECHDEDEDEDDELAGDGRPNAYMLHPRATERSRAPIVGFKDPQRRTGGEEGPGRRTDFLENGKKQQMRGEEGPFKGGERSPQGEQLERRGAGVSGNRVWDSAARRRAMLEADVTATKAALDSKRRWMFQVDLARRKLLFFTCWVNELDERRLESLAAAVSDEWVSQQEMLAPKKPSSGPEAALREMQGSLAAASSANRHHASSAYDTGMLPTSLSASPKITPIIEEPSNGGGVSKRGTAEEVHWKPKASTGKTSQRDLKLLEELD